MRYHVTLAAAARARRLRHDLPQRCLANGLRHPASTAALARHDDGSRPCAAAVADVALREPIEDDLATRARVCLFERNLDVVAEVGAALGTRPSRRRARACCRRTCRRCRRTDPLPNPKPPGPAAPVADDAEAVVLRALIWIGQDLVRLVDFFETMFGPRFVVRDVGMVLARQLAISLFDLVPRCASARHRGSRSSPSWA